MQNRLGDLICPPSKKSFYYQGFFAVKWRAVFILGAKRTVAPPNAKHSTLLQDCFLCFCFFDSIHDSATMHNLSPEIFYWTKFMSKIFFIIEKNALFLHFLSVLLDFFFFLCIFVVSFQGQSTGKCANLMPH